MYEPYLRLPVGPPYYPALVGYDSWKGQRVGNRWNGNYKCFTCEWGWCTWAVYRQIYTQPCPVLAVLTPFHKGVRLPHWNV